MLPLLTTLVVLSTAKPDTAVVPMKEVVVSATRTHRDAIDVPNATAVVNGNVLRRHGTMALADALQDVVGLDTGNGSDNGNRLPNIGMWGLHEFDALLVTNGGVPAGGPFNPSLSQIPVEDLDRVEIVKGPQGTLYGVSAFAGMIQAFPRTAEPTKGHLTLSGASFSQFSGTGGVQWPLEENHSLRLSGTALHGDSWQDRTGNDVYRGDIDLHSKLGSDQIGVTVFGYHDRQDWGTPLPFEGGVRAPEFEIDKNYAVGGAKVEHNVFGVTTQSSGPVTKDLKYQNTLSLIYDDQTLTRSFIGTVSNDTVYSAGTDLNPTETSVYWDSHAISNFDAGGPHELVGGVALTWGRTKGNGHGFDIEQYLPAYPAIPDIGQVPPGDDRAFEDRRTFFGAYLHDEWTPTRRVTLGGGGRYDNVSEELSASAQEIAGPGPLELARDSRTDHAWSGDASLLVRTAPAAGWLEAANFYVNYKSAFKPAAPNLLEPEGAEILEPEWTHSVEGGLKTRAFGQIALDLSLFQMDFENMVVPIDVGGLPGLTNAGRERFKGYEADARWSPKRLAAATLGVGYAHHDARFVDFVSDEGGVITDVSGNFIEQTPKDLFNANAEYAPAEGLGGFVSMRWRGERFFARDNAEKLDPYSEWDAGATFDVGKMLIVVAGRNLGDSRHVVTESELGPDQVYLAAPRRFTAEVTYRF
jgi:outer membrane receptor protein involved in Fe transport